MNYIQIVIFVLFLAMFSGYVYATDWTNLAHRPMYFDPGVPSLQVINNGLGAPTDLDLVQTAETNLSKADFLFFSNYIDAYDYVKDEITYEPYYGSKKGAFGTYLEKRGNDIDKASLLIGLLRDQQIPARYVFGTIELSESEANAWIGTNNLTATYNILYKNGVLSKIIEEGGTKKLQVSHYWVKAYIDGKWIDLDPAMNKYRLEQGNLSDILETIDKLNNYLSLVSKNTIDIENINGSDIFLNEENETINWLKTNDIFSIKSTNQFLKRILEKEQVKYSKIILGESASINESLSYKINFRLSDIDYTLKTSEISGKRITLSYIANKSGTYSTPVLSIDGEVVAVGNPTPQFYSFLYYSSGDVNQTLTVKITTPFNTYSFDETIQPTQYTIVSVVPNLGKVTKDFLDLRDRQKRANEEINKTGANLLSEDIIGEKMYKAGLEYFYFLDMLTDITDSQRNIITIRHPSVAIVSGESIKYTETNYYNSRKLSLKSKIDIINSFSVEDNAIRNVIPFELSSSLAENILNRWFRYAPQSQYFDYGENYFVTPERVLKTVVQSQPYDVNHGDLLVIDKNNADTLPYIGKTKDMVKEAVANGNKVIIPNKATIFLTRNPGTTDSFYGYGVNGESYFIYWKGTAFYTFNENGGKEEFLVQSPLQTSQIKSSSGAIQSVGGISETSSSNSAPSIPTSEKDPGQLIDRCISCVKEVCEKVLSCDMLDEAKDQLEHQKNKKAQLEKQIADLKNRIQQLEKETQKPTDDINKKIEEINNENQKLNASLAPLNKRSEELRKLINGTDSDFYTDKYTDEQREKLEDEWGSVLYQIEKLDNEIKLNNQKIRELEILKQNILNNKIIPILKEQLKRLENELRVTDSWIERLKILIERCKEGKPINPFWRTSDDKFSVDTTVLDPKTKLDSLTRNAHSKGLESIILVKEYDHHLEHLSNLSLDKQSILEWSKEKARLYNAIADTSELLEFERDQAPDIAVLDEGFSKEIGIFLDSIKEPYKLVKPSIDLGELESYKVFVLPSASLVSTSSKTFKETLNQYVLDGGALVVFSQPYDKNYEILPGNVSAYGYEQDQNCLSNSIGISSFGPELSSIRGDPTAASNFAVNVDGYFKKWPANTTVLLLRQKNSQPAMVSYKYGLGKVVATTIYEDTAYSHNQARGEGISIMRDTIRAALSEIPENLAVGDNKQVVISINVTNFGGTNVTGVMLRILYPNTDKVDSVNVSTNLLPGETKEINFTYITPNVDYRDSWLGIYKLDYSLLHGQDIVQNSYGVGQISVSRFKGDRGGWTTVGSKLSFSINSDKQTYVWESPIRLVVTVQNRDSVSRNITVYRVRGHEEPWGYISNATKQSLGTYLLQSGEKKELEFFTKMHPYDDFGAEAFFYENNTFLGKAYIAIGHVEPKVNLDITADKKEYNLGDIASYKVDLDNNFKEPYSFILKTVLRDPRGNVVSEDQRNLSVTYGSSNNLFVSSSNEKSDEVVIGSTIELPIKYKLLSPVSGNYQIYSEMWIGDMLWRSKSEYFKLKEIYQMRANLDKSETLSGQYYYYYRYDSATYRAGQNASIFINITNTGANILDTNITLKSDLYNTTQSLIMPLNEKKNIAIDFKIPDNITPGLHELNLTSSIDNITFHLYVNILDANLNISSEKIGNNINVYISNIGGSVAVSQCNASLKDLYGKLIYNNMFDFLIRVDQQEKISIESSEKINQGSYTLSLVCKSQKQIITHKKSFVLDGVIAEENTTTDKENYLPFEKSNISTIVANTKSKDFSGYLLINVSRNYCDPINIQYCSLLQESIFGSKDVVYLAKDESKSLSNALELKAAGMYTVTSSLYNDLDQLVSIKQISFFVQSQNMKLIFTTNKEFYKQEEKIEIAGIADNKGFDSGPYILEIKEEGKNSFYTETFTLDPGKSKTFTTSTTSNTIGQSTIKVSIIPTAQSDNGGGLITGQSAGANGGGIVPPSTNSLVDAYKSISIEQPLVSIKYEIPDTTDHNQFDVHASIENKGNVPANIQIKINDGLNDFVKQIFIEPGKTELVSQKLQSGNDFKLKIGITGDYEDHYEKQISIGDYTKLNFLTTSYPFEGKIPLKIKLSNKGLLDSKFNAVFIVDNKPTAKEYVVPANSEKEDVISFDLSKGSHFLSYVTPFESGNTTVYITSNPAFELVEVPKIKLIAGMNNTIKFKIKNVGYGIGSTNLELVPETLLLDEKKYIESITLDKEQEGYINFILPIPDDLEEKDYSMKYIWQGKEYDLPYNVQGINISSLINLDKKFYREGDVAVATLLVKNNRDRAVELFSRIKFNNYENDTFFSLGNNEEKTFVFNVPIVFDGPDTKMLYAIYHKDGRSISINNTYIYKDTEEKLKIYTDYQLYKPGDTVKIIIKNDDVLAKRVFLTFHKNATVLDIPAQSTKEIEYILKDMQSGTYNIVYNFEDKHYVYPIDIDGFLVESSQLVLDKNEYILGDTITLNYTVDASRGLNGSVDFKLYDNSDLLVTNKTVIVALQKGKNLIQTNMIFNGSKNSVYRVVSRIRANLSGHSEVVMTEMNTEFDGKADITPPKIVLYIPFIDLSLREVLLTFKTDEVASCRYSATPNKIFSEMSR